MTKTKKKVHAGLRIAGFLLVIIPVMAVWEHLEESDPARRYTPPPEQALQSAHGRFLPQAYEDCGEHKACPPLRFRTDDNRVIAVNCEPLPAMNQCLFDGAGEGDNKAWANRPLTIRYYASSADPTRPDHVVLTVADESGDLITYAHRVAEIKDTRVHYNVGRWSVGKISSRIANNADFERYWDTFWFAVWALALLYFVPVGLWRLFRRPKTAG